MSYADDHDVWILVLLKRRDESLKLTSYQQPMIDSMALEFFWCRTVVFVSLCMSDVDIRYYAWGELTHGT